MKRSWDRDTPRKWSLNGESKRSLEMKSFNKKKAGPINGEIVVEADGA